MTELAAEQIARLLQAPLLGDLLANDANSGDGAGLVLDRVKLLDPAALHAWRLRDLTLDFHVADGLPRFKHLPEKRLGDVPGGRNDVEKEASDMLVA